MLIDELVRAFENATLPIDLWTHESHLSVSLWYLRHHARGEATRRIRTGIQRYNAANNRPGAYHETITLAWIEILSQLCAERGSEAAFDDLRAETLACFAGKDFLLKFYSRDLLFSEAARAKWCLPDQRLFSSVRISEMQSMSESGAE